MRRILAALLPAALLLSLCACGPRAPEPAPTPEPSPPTPEEEITALLADLFGREGGTAECWPWIIPGSGPWGAYFDREAYLPRLEALVRACTWERMEDNFPAQTSEPVQGPEGSANAIWLVGGRLFFSASLGSPQISFRESGENGAVFSRKFRTPDYEAFYEGLDALWREADAVQTPLRALDRIFEEGRGRAGLLLELADGGVYSAPCEGEARLEYLFGACTWSPVWPAPEAPPGGDRLVLENPEHYYTLTFYADEALVNYHEAGVDLWYRAEGGGDGPLYRLLREEFDGAQVREAREGVALALDTDDWDEVAAAFLAAYGENLLAMAPGGRYSVTDFAAPAWEIYDRGTDAFALRCDVAVRPEDPASSFWWMGNGSDGEGDWEGYIVSTLEFRLAYADGLWRCTDSGTGGVKA